MSEMHPYGAGSHSPLANPEEMPPCYPIKGNADSMKYHRPDSSGYANTMPEVWFVSPSMAEAAGFKLAGSHPKGSSSADFELDGDGHPCTVEQYAALSADASDETMTAGAAADLRATLDADETMSAGVAGSGSGETDELHPFGVGSHAPLDDVHEMPQCYPIKGNAGSMKYHRPDSQGYPKTKAEVWFVSPSAAEAAGFKLAGSHPEGSSSADFEPGGSGHPCTADEVSNRLPGLGISAGAAGTAAAVGVTGVAAAAAAAAGSSDIDDTVRVSSADKDTRQTIQASTADTEPYGPGSRSPLANVDEVPECFLIKGNINSNKYYRPDSSGYDQTDAEIWFISPSVAEAAGFELAASHPEGSSSADFEPGGTSHPCSVEQMDGLGFSGLGFAAAGAGAVAAVAGAASFLDDDDMDVTVAASSDVVAEIKETIEVEPTVDAPTIDDTLEVTELGSIEIPEVEEESGLGGKAAIAGAAGAAAIAGAAALLGDDDDTEVVEKVTGTVGDARETIQTDVRETVEETVTKPKAAASASVSKGRETGRRSSDGCRGSRWRSR